LVKTLESLGFRTRVDVGELLTILLVRLAKYF